MSSKSTPIANVRCDVSSCEYHTESNECTANAINVVKHHGDGSNETDCGTYAKKNCCGQ
ncbi:MAG: DUF1540 domain-containing protein [Clostridia bacterium]|nr:DUF1540 domain-containing protein [Clostridia bacterium]